MGYNYQVILVPYRPVWVMTIRTFPIISPRSYHGHHLLSIIIVIALSWHLKSEGQQVLMLQTHNRATVKSRTDLGLQTMVSGRVRETQNSVNAISSMTDTYRKWMLRGRGWNECGVPVLTRTTLLA